MGPVEYLLVEFPGNKFKGEIVPALIELVENETIRIIDLLSSRKMKRVMSAALSFQRFRMTSQPRLTIWMAKSAIC